MSNDKKNIKEFYKIIQQKINYIFKDTSFIDNVFVHPSYNNNIEFDRLEFIGDGILTTVCRRFLYKTFKTEETGDLVLRFIHITRSDSLAKIMVNMELAEYIQCIGSPTTSILADTIEALIGAICIDRGYTSCQSFIEKKIIKILLSDPQKNCKNLVQEWAQKKGMQMPIYKCTGEHRNFTVIVRLNDLNNRNIFCRGSGVSKKEASMSAATKLWDNIIKNKKLENIV
jgi:ribonuclease-3